MKYGKVLFILNMVVSVSVATGGGERHAVFGFANHSRLLVYPYPREVYNRLFEEGENAGFEEAAASAIAEAANGFKTHEGLR